MPSSLLRSISSVSLSKKNNPQKSRPLVRVDTSIPAAYDLPRSTSSITAPYDLPRSTTNTTPSYDLPRSATNTTPSYDLSRSTTNSPIQKLQRSNTIASSSPMNTIPLQRSNTLTSTTSQAISRSEIKHLRSDSVDDATTIVDTPTDSSLLKPIVFTLSNVEPDVFLNVFGQEIQVHSMCLSVASPYFRKFLGDRLGRYEWVTKVEEGGKGWVLVRGDLMIGQSDSYDLIGNTDIQIHSLLTLLQAIYQQPITLTSSNHLQRTTKLAILYGCLPALSNSVTSALFHSPGLTKNIRKQCVELLPIAATLKNKPLFKECLIHLTGPWSNPLWQQVKNPELRAIAERAHGKVLAEVGRFQQSLFNIATQMEKEEWIDFNAKIGALACECMVRTVSTNTSGSAIKTTSSTTKTMLMPLYYRRLYDLNGKTGVPLALSRRLVGLMRNNLCLDRSGIGAGQRDPVKTVQGNEDWFLCGEIEDCDLPWVVEEAPF